MQSEWTREKLKNYLPKQDEARSLDISSIHFLSSNNFIYKFVIVHIQIYTHWYLTKLKDIKVSASVLDNGLK